MAGQSLMDAFNSQGPANAPTSELLGYTRVADDGSAMFLDGDGVASALYGDCDSAVSVGRWSE
jgi:hypothetical protein